MSNEGVEKANADANLGDIEVKIAFADTYADKKVSLVDLWFWDFVAYHSAVEKQLQEKKDVET